MKQVPQISGSKGRISEISEDTVALLSVGSELASMERLRQLFDAFTEKHEILHLLDECMRAEGVQIFIGEESGYQLLEGCSVVTAPYEIDDEVVGVLGVIGPTRMAYERIIPVVDVTAKLLGAALKQW